MTAAPSIARGARATALGLAAALLLPGPPAHPRRAAPEPAPELRSVLVARGTAEAFVVVRLTGDLRRREGGGVRASMRVAGRTTGRVVPLDRISFRHYCFRAALRRPWPPVGRRAGVALRSPALPRTLRTTRTVVRARPGDGIGARLGCRLPFDTAGTGAAAPRPHRAGSATAGRS